MSESTKELDVAVAVRIMETPVRDDGTPWPGNVLPYSTSIEAAMQVEDRIAELGLRTRYVLELAKIVDPRESREDKVALLWWALVHASAEQRCRAALAAIGGKE
jgi:hypothetical protein